MSARMRIGSYTLAVLALLATAARATPDPAELMPCKVAILKSGVLGLAKFVCRGTFALPSAANAPTQGDAIINIYDSPGFASFLTVLLPGGGWTGLGNPAGSNGYKYKGVKAPGSCSVALIKPTVVKAVCWNDGNLSVPLDGSARIILASIGDDSKTYCAKFGGTVLKNDDRQFKAKNALAPGYCSDVTNPPMTGLAQWIRADSGVAVDGSNNVVSWADQSGNGRHWSPGGGAVQLVPNAQNGLPIVRASTTGSYLTTPAYFSGTQQAEVLVLIRSNQLEGSVNYSWNGFGADAANINHYPLTTSQIYESFGHTTRQGAFLSYDPDGDATRAYGIYNVSAGAGAGNYVVRLNGAELGAVAGSPGWHAGTFYLFSYWFNQSFQFLGDIGEMLVYDHVLSESDRATAYQYLKQKWDTPDAP